MSKKLTLTIAIVLATCFTNLATLTVTNDRPYWHHCFKCHVMFSTEDSSGKACAAGGVHVVQGYEFRLPYDRPETKTTQADWRLCRSCGALFYKGFENKGKKGRCPAGGAHVEDNSFRYSLVHDVPGTATAQSAWRFCNKCYAMFYDGFPDKGHCAAGGPHVAQGYNFVLPHGSAVTQAPAPPPAPKPPPIPVPEKHTPQPTTTTSIWPNGKAYLFNGSQYVRYDAKADKADQGYPAPIAGNWPGFPPAFQEGVDAEVVWNNQKVYFFKGDQFLRYDIATDRVDPGYPLPIAGHWPGLWTDHIDAGVVWPNGKAYFFHGSQYIRYDIATGKTDPGYPAEIKGGWPGFPASFAAGVDNAVVWNNGKAYFFKGSEYIRYDIAADKTDPGFPQSIAANWRGLAQ